MLPLRFIDRAKFFVERQFVKGALFQLLVVGAIIGLISLAGGLLVYPAGEGADAGDAVWWAFLRLTDPGYLGDDEGTWRRLISTILTISGYVVFMGTLVAILTRSLIARMTELERGMTPVAFRNHVVILGWNSRTLPLVRELLSASGSMRRFLLGRATSRLKLVVLAEDMSAGHAQILRNEPGIGAKARQVVLRSGSALQTEALHRAACLNAAAVIIPSGSQEFNSLVSSDVETIKALMSIDAQARRQKIEPPFVVAEIQDLRKLSIAHRSYHGPLEVVAGDATIASLLAQNILHPGLSEVYNELLMKLDGNEFYVRSGDNFKGETLGAIAMRCPNALVCGMLEACGGGWQVRLNPPSSTLVREQDKVVMIAHDMEDTEPVKTTGHRLTPIERLSTDKSQTLTSQKHHKRVLLLGWNHRVPALVHELGSYRQYRFAVDVVSIVPPVERERAIERYHPSPLAVQCQHIESDFMQEGELHDIDPARYDSILLLSSDRTSTGEEADARVIVGHTMLEELLDRASRRPQLIMELSDPDNEVLIGHQQSETIISPLILSHLLAQVALRPELRLVFGDLFTEGGAEILFRPPEHYGIKSALPFWKLEALAAERGETAMGVYYAQPQSNGQRLQLNPARNAALTIKPEDEVVILTDTGIRKGGQP
ncbi:CASTOR/POLLUX-related putative ion channel [Marinimicrobium sp. C2-29]|uniref:CASTOR/POLLUX-related putative ion channel n=1 Tax=Marinimicrobium sp. C2-29 TaxID=3139825 RepID=UPI003139BC95